MSALIFFPKTNIKYHKEKGKVLLRQAGKNLSKVVSCWNMTGFCLVYRDIFNYTESCLELLDCMPRITKVTTLVFVGANR